MLCLLACVSFVACSKRENETGVPYAVYFVDKEETLVDSDNIKIEGGDTDVVLTRLLESLQEEPEEKSYRSAIPSNVKLLGYTLEDKKLTLNFDVTYRDMSVAGEVLSRAAIVRTVCQLNDVKYVAFEIAGEPLATSTGAVVGYMTDDLFVDNQGNEINAMEKANLTLYYATEDGTGLRAYTVECYYNGNISQDKLVMEKLISGPKGGGSDETGFPTISKHTSIISVTTQDGVCYVNLNEDFSLKESNVTSEVAIYSIVNSLTELPDVNKVQISIDGNSDVKFMEAIDLDEPFSRNLDIVNDAK